MKEIFLHIGANKTGSTSIQNFLNKNLDWLRRNGVLYPQFGIHDNAHYELSESLGFGPKLSSKKRFSLSKLRKIIENSEEEKVVLSSEYFMLSGNFEELKQLLKGFRVKVVVYFRRHDLWFESLYNQAVKTALNPPWEKGAQSYLDYQLNRGKQKFDYLESVREWAEHFGEDSIVVRPFEKSQFYNKDLISDFLKILGVDPEGRPHGEGQNLNASLSVRVLDFVDSVNRQKGISIPHKAAAVHAVAEVTKNDKKRFALSPEQRLALIQRFEPSYAEIAKRFLGREDGRLFYEPLPDVDEEWREPEKATLAQAMGLFASLAKRYGP